jgi:hypothetical protein
VCCQTRDPLTGKAHAVRESSRSDRYKVAAQLLAQRLGALAHGKPVTPTTVRLTFHDAARDLLNDYRVNGKRSLVDVERHITKHLAPFFGGLRMADITTAHVREYVARRQREGAANATINRELAALRRSFTLAIAAGSLSTRPAIPLLREENARRGFFEAAQFEAVRRHLPPDLADFVTFAARPSAISCGPVCPSASPCSWSAGGRARCSTATTS